MTDPILYGIHAVLALLSNPKRRTKQIYFNKERKDSRIEELLALAQKNKVSAQALSIQELNQRFPEIQHQGIVAITEPLRQYHEQDLEQLLAQDSKKLLILILDGITDPHNLGACLRTADAAAVDFILIPKDKSAALTPAACKVASGAAENIPLIRVTNLARSIQLLKNSGVWIYGAALEATKSIYDIDFKASSAIVMGAEGSGMRRLTREHCDDLFLLPMLGTVSSLNVSVAAGVCLYEALRQRRV